MKQHVLTVLAGTSLLALMAAAPVQAQGAQPEAPNDPSDTSEIIVTGSQIRGIAPAGVQIVGVTEEEITSAGAASGQDVLTTLPQVSNMFQAEPAPGNNNSIFADRLPVARPNLRNLPNINLTSVGFTLVLVDGHRMVPVGIQYGGIDADAVPASLLRRVEVMPDGASAIYGSDAVAGVINFITRDSYDGVRVSGRYGLAKNYWAYDANVTAGTKWETGSAFVSLTRTDHDWILGRDRDFIQGIDWNEASPTYRQALGRSCANPNISFAAAGGATRFYPLTSPGGTIQSVTTNGGSLAGSRIGGGNRCDTVDGGNTTTGADQSYFPKQKKHSIAGGLTQDIGDRLRLAVRGFWNRTVTTNSGGPYLTTANVCGPNGPSSGFANCVAGRPNPFYRDVSAAGAGNFNPLDVGANQQVLFSWEPVFGPLSKRLTTSEWWQITPELTWKLGGDWQVRGLASYGESDSRAAFDQLDTRAATGVQARINAGLINPYNLNASAPGAFDNLVQVGRRYGKFKFTNFRVIADGSLFSLPGGDLRAAIGAEYAKTKLTQGLTDANFQFGPAANYTQTVKSLFGEIQVPIVSDENSIVGVHSFLISGSLRHDRYNDFGETTNPSIGVTYNPVSWVKVRANWNKSFTAPSAGDQIGKQLVRFQAIPGGTPVFPLPQYGGGSPFPATAAIAFLNQGTIGGIDGDPPSLSPQTSKAWSLGIDFEPPIVPGFRLGASYYDLRIKGLISSPGTPQQIITQYPQYVYCHSTVAGQLGAPSNSAAADCRAPLSPAEVAKYVAAGTPASISDTGFFPGGANADYLTGGRQVAYVMDIRSRNLGAVHATGLDFHADYQRPTGWGSIDLSFAGNYQIGLKQDSGPGTAKFDVLEYDAAKWRWSAKAGTNLGGFRAQITWQHTSGYRLKPGLGGSGGVAGTSTAPCVGACGQEKVSAFDTFDLFFKYDFSGEDRFTKDLSFTLNVNNLFDTDPPLLRALSGFANGFTLGRFVQVGLVKEF